MELNRELLSQAKEAKTADELAAFAKENGIELTEEKAKEYFAKLNAKNEELSDEELDNVSGGGCKSSYTINGVTFTDDEILNGGEDL